MNTARQSPRWPPWCASPRAARGRAADHAAAANARRHLDPDAGSGRRRHAEVRERHEERCRLRPRLRRRKNRDRGRPHWRAWRRHRHRPRRVKEANANAKAAGVSDQVKIIQGDIFDPSLKISDATVVTLYLLECAERQAAPRLKAELKPGTRIVSNAFTMGQPGRPSRPSRSASIRSTSGRSSKK